MGYELAGSVEDAPVGSSLRRPDVVIIMPYLPCGTCHSCAHGKTDCCCRIQGSGRVPKWHDKLHRRASTFVSKATGITLAKRR